MKPELSAASIERVLAALPQLRARYEATAAQCRAEGLPDAAPELFLFEYSHELLQAYRADPAAARDPLGALTATLESEYGTDADADSLIEGSFLALLVPGVEPDPAGLLGPKLARVLGVERHWRADPADTAFVARLVAAVPALKPLARENESGDHGDVLVHGFLADLVRREVGHLEAGRLEEVRAVLDLLEQEWGGEVDEPIAVSFVENLPWPHQPGAGLLGLLGPKLRAELVQQRGAGGG